MSPPSDSLIASTFDAGAIRSYGFPLQPLDTTLPPRNADSRANEIAVIRYELRNSLSVVRHAARLLRLPMGADGIAQARVLIERHIDQMSLHIEELLDAPPDWRTRSLRLSHANLQTVVEHAVSAVAPDMLRHGHRLVVTLPQVALWVHADVARLEQVFLNLLTSAARHTPDGGDIALTMERIGTQACIRICDSGIGLSAAMQRRLFQLFAQADAQDRQAEGGRDMELAVVRTLIEAHAGSVQVTSAGPGMGSRFTVMLPAGDHAAGSQPAAHHHA